MNLEAFELVILRFPADAPEWDDVEGERLQREHLAYLAAQREGARSEPGRCGSRPIRACVVYRTGSLEEARRISLDDPMVRAGHLEADVMTWLCPPGTMGRPGRAVHVPDR